MRLPEYTIKAPAEAFIEIKLSDNPPYCADHECFEMTQKKTALMHTKQGVALLWFNNFDQP